MKTNLYGTYKYNAPSWSQIAREFADRVIEQCSPTNYEWAEELFSHSYRGTKIVNRACKRYYRKFKKNIKKA